MRATSMLGSLNLSVLSARLTSRCPSGLGQWKGIDVYSLHGTGHIDIHCGEIACLKGIQGERGSVGGLRPVELFP
jgi:hypothetical protein